ncbi:TetR/AcrR family transcriptional regulator [Saccharothrix sp. Mg75]|uniref:TetR/AcrR family transcriptional regulator n=1 Tax=Saccharothrix sp. Mg75 TaxID=3445357 RepID=UPI003EEB51EA
MPRPKTHDDALRARLLVRAGELLSAEGPGALSLRRLAADVNTSTTAVYSLFGGKPALLNALYEEAFRRFGERLAEVPRTDDPVEDLVQLGLAYRRSALADPQFYLVMYAKVVPGFEPSAEVFEASCAAFEPLLAHVTRALEAGLFAPNPSARLAVGVWGTVHGLLTLELNGNVPPELGLDAIYEGALRALTDGWRARR